MLRRSFVQSVLVAAGSFFAPVELPCSTTVEEAEELSAVLADIAPLPPVPHAPIFAARHIAVTPVIWHGGQVRYDGMPNATLMGRPRRSR